MDKEELKQLLKDYLTIEVKEDNSYGTSSVDVSIKFDDEVICSDSYYLSRCLD